MERVTVVGLGYVGLPSAALIANSGYQVHGVDVNEALVNELQSGICRLQEEEVLGVVHKALGSGKLKASTQCEPADIFVICVPTPIQADKTPDLSMVQAAARSVAACVKKGDMVILESTSPIGTTEKIIGGAMTEAGFDPLEDIDICYCPERVFPGDTVREILENDRVVGGLTPAAASRARDFYLSYCIGQPNLTYAAAAEFSKLMENTFRDVNIALANVFAKIAEQANVDVMDVISMANKHPRVNVHTPGPGVGGHCIPVDPWFLIDAFPEESSLLKKSRIINDTQANYFFTKAKMLGLKANQKVAILGAAYRGDIDDSRDSPTELLISALAHAGHTYITHDPHVTHMKLHGGHAPNLTNNLTEALDGASAAFIMTDHTAYKSLSPEQFAKMDTKLIIDTRRIIDADAFLDNGFTVALAGAPTLEN